MTGITVAAVQKIVDELSALIASETGAPPVIPTVIPPSSGITEIVPGGTPSSLTDGEGHVWTFGDRFDNRGYRLMRDGKQAFGDGVGVRIVLSGGEAWTQEASYGHWAVAKRGATYWTIMKDVGPPPTSAPTPTPPPTPGAGLSPEGTTITAPGAGKSITDGQGHVWSFGVLMVPDAHRPGPDWLLLKDGNPIPVWPWAGQSMTINSGVMSATSTNRWGPLVYKDVGTGGAWALVSGTP